MPKGHYTLYCVPAETKWTIIINKDNFCWGNFIYDLKKDVLRTIVTVNKMTECVDAMTMYFEETKTGANLLIEWDDVKASLAIDN